jgi:DivIVA domain-containing protein
VALERQSIEKRDFPIGRRGYDPDAVDAHLSQLADEVDELKLSSRKRSETLASTASEQVRSIVEAAESSASDIQAQAEDEAREIRAEAAAEAQSARERATSQAREYVGKVSEATGVMMQRLDAIESELSALIEGLRAGAQRLQSDLQLLEGNLGDVNSVLSLRPRFEPEPEPEPDQSPAAGSSAASSAPVAVAQPAPAEVETEPEAPAAAAESQAPAQAAEPQTPAVSAESVAQEPDAGSNGEIDDGEDTEGARLVALNMALQGTPREETDRYLADNFGLSDRTTLLDEVYASVDG